MTAAASSGVLAEAGAAERLAQAEQAFADRELESVRRAARWWLEAAAAESVRLEALVGAIRARVWLVDREPDGEQRRRLAREAVHAGQWCERSAGDDPRCAYWLAVALGVQARERRSTALDALTPIVERLQRALAADPTLDRGGPNRVLALVYLRAPGWPAGPGDPDLGLEQARAAVAVDPAYPPNQLALAEALAVTEDAGASCEAYRRAAQTAENLVRTGDKDAPRWLDEARAGGNRPCPVPLPEGDTQSTSPARGGVPGVRCPSRRSSRRR